MSLTIQSGGSVTIQGGSGGGGASLVPVSAYSTSASTFVVTGSNVNQFGDFTTGGSVSVTTTVGASGILLIGIGCSVYSSTTITGYSILSAALSGANTRTADQVASIGAAIWSQPLLGAGQQVYTQIALSGLTPGSTTVALRIRNSYNGQTLRFDNRSIMAIPL